MAKFENVNYKDNINQSLIIVYSSSLLAVQVSFLKFLMWLPPSICDNLIMETDLRVLYDKTILINCTGDNEFVAFPRKNWI